MKIVNKIFYVVATVIELLLLIGIYVVNYFANARMGMARFISAKNYKWETLYDMTEIKYMCIIILIVLMVLTLILYLKRKSYLNKVPFRMSMVMIVLVVIFVGFNLLYSTYDYRAFYFISAMLGLATILQIIKTNFALFLCKEN